jgi:hypothetical protein
MRVFALFVLAIFGTAACSSTTAPGSADAPPSPPPTPTPVLDFSAIAGDWAGEGNDLNQPAFYEIEITVGAEAAEGSQAGTISYEGTLHDLTISCGGKLFARLANGNTYEFTENITSGTNCVTGGTVRLIHDAATSTLDYEAVAPESSHRSGQLVARGVLTRKE